LYITRDFGVTWRALENTIRAISDPWSSDAVKWSTIEGDPENRIYALVPSPEEDGTHQLIASDNFFDTKKVLLTHVKHFYIAEDTLIAEQVWCLFFYLS